jgi:hypothetical protein
MWLGRGGRWEGLNHDLERFADVRPCFAFRSVMRRPKSVAPSLSHLFQTLHQRGGQGSVSHVPPVSASHQKTTSLGEMAAAGLRARPKRSRLDWLLELMDSEAAESSDEEEELPWCGPSSAPF